MKAFDLLNTKLSDLQANVDAMSPTERLECISELDATIQAAALLRGYVNSRTWGEDDHARAVKNANRLKSKIRKILGFSYPDAATIQF